MSTLYGETLRNCSLQQDLLPNLTTLNTHFSNRGYNPTRIHKITDDTLDIQTEHTAQNRLDESTFDTRRPKNLPLLNQHFPTLPSTLHVIPQQYTTGDHKQLKQTLHIPKKKKKPHTHGSSERLTKKGHTSIFTCDLYTSFNARNVTKCTYEKRQ